LCSVVSSEEKKEEYNERDFIPDDVLKKMDSGEKDAP